MFKNPTVFVLGAGASWHYGYPTGEALVGEMLESARHLGEIADYFVGFSNPPQPDFFNLLSPESQNTPKFKAKWVKFKSLLSEFTIRLNNADPLVIDYFLGHNRPLADLGRLLIAWVLHHRAYKTSKYYINSNRYSPHLAKDDQSKINDNWCRFIISKLSQACTTSSDLLKNDIRFITFNYDKSLEGALSRGLSALSVFDDRDIQKFLSDDRIIHVYGALTGGKFGLLDKRLFDTLHEFIAHKIHPSDTNKMTFLVDLIDVTWRSGTSIRIIDPEDKGANAEMLDLSKRSLRDALYVYVLGYGFDSNNNERIGLTGDNMKIGKENKNIFFTNFQNSNRINKIVGSLVSNKFDAFLDKEIFNPRPGYFIEKSQKNVYDSLALDFF